MARILLRLSVLLFVIVAVGFIGLNRGINPQNVGRIQAHAITIEITGTGAGGALEFAGAIDCVADELAPNDTCLAALSVQNTGEASVALSFPELDVSGGLTTCGGGLGQGLGHAIGVALANRDKGRLTINIQFDGDMLFTPAAIWTAVHHRIPLLIVMFNNRTYGNDLGHQGTMAAVRGRPDENKTIGIDIDDPLVDFAGLARSFGAWAEGPIERAEDLKPAFERAKHEVVENGRVALVDLYTQVT